MRMSDDGCMTTDCTFHIVHRMLEKFMGRQPTQPRLLPDNTNIDFEQYVILA